MGTAAAGAAALGAVAGASSLVPHVAAVPSVVDARQLEGAGEGKGASPVPKPAQAIPSNWDYSADVVVVGYGFAGQAAAITAANNGASVVILEKQARNNHTANSQMCLGAFVSPTNVSEAYTFMQKLSRINLDTPESQDMADDVIMAWATSMSENKAWLASLGVAGFGSYAAAGRFPNIPGNGAIASYEMKKPDGTTGVGLDLFNFLDGIIEGNNQTKILWATPATHLIQNTENGAILGVNAGTTGLNIKANKAVILTCGGYEYNDEMLKTFTCFYPIVFYGNPDNTGDGVRMGQEVGAAMSHMTIYGGGLKARFKSFPTGFLLAQNPTCGYIFVDKTGNRFADENSLGGYSGYWNAVYDNVTYDTLQRIPCYWIFDSAQMKAGPLAYTSFAAAGPIGMYTWSPDNSAELANGWILQGADIPTLVGAINQTQSDPVLTSQPWTVDVTLDPNVVSAAVSTYNAACAAKVDGQFGRSANTLVPISKPPYYAVILWPGMNNTYGGPLRNGLSQVIGTNGSPIPRLYSAGELGSVYVHYPQGGANVGECLAFGRIAGANAAALTSWS